MALHSRHRPMSEINVVPYIDVMLVLLVIFMVTAPLITPGVVELPSVSKSSNAPLAPLEIVIRADQTVLVRMRDARGGISDEQRIGRAELAKLVHERQAKSPDMPVLIAADRNVRYEAVLRVMDDLQREQVKRVGLLVKPAQ